MIIDNKKINNKVFLKDFELMNEMFIEKNSSDLSVILNNLKKIKINENKQR